MVKDSFEKAPLVSEQLIEFLELNMNSEVLLTEETVEGLERLGFIKGARFVLNRLQAIRMFQSDIY